MVKVPLVSLKKYCARSSLTCLEMATRFQIFRPNTANEKLSNAALPGKLSPASAMLSLTAASPRELLSRHRICKMGTHASNLLLTNTSSQQELQVLRQVKIELTTLGL